MQITEDNERRLRGVIARNGATGKDKALLNELERIVEGAEIVSGEIAPYIITMNSRFVLEDLDTGITSEYTLVYPDEAHIEQGRISVLSPIGLALLGRQELDTVERDVPAGVKRFQIKKLLHQPEAARAYSL